MTIHIPESNETRAAALRKLNADAIVRALKAGHVGVAAFTENNADRVIAIAARQLLDGAAAETLAKATIGLEQARAADRRAIKKKMIRVDARVRIRRDLAYAGVGSLGVSSGMIPVLAEGVIVELRARSRFVVVFDGRPGSRFEVAIDDADMHDNSWNEWI